VRAADAFADTEQPHSRVFALHSLAWLRVERGDRDGADGAWSEALAVLEQTDDPARAQQERAAIEEVRARLARRSAAEPAPNRRRQPAPKRRRRR
jgi:hypothetical protein